MAELTVSNAAAGRLRLRALPSSLAQALGLALVALVAPLSAASAQSAHIVRVTGDKVAIRSHEHAKGDVVMTAAQGTMLDVIHTEGDRFVHRDNNWYWVLLPRDAWGTQRAGWVSGREVEEVSRTEGRPTTGIPVSATERIASASAPAASAATSAPAVASVSYSPVVPAVAPATSGQPEVAEVVLNFDFAKSNLTEEANRKLTDAMSHLTPNSRVSFAVEGYADAIGSEKYNKRLGLERAETVKRQLAAQHHITADQVEVVSYGESQPAATNQTEEGRAQNRRVVIKVGR